ncbi:MAG: diguanylate cyclase protein [Xanthomonadaceae bacterium]|nr:diguanylate cyclase protein [Xanthomonadaceae bacterium]
MAAAPHWVERLVAGITPVQIANVLLELVRTRPDCTDACVVFRGQDTPMTVRPSGEAASPADPDALALARRAVEAGTRTWSTDRRRVALPLTLPAVGVLVLSLAPDTDGIALCAALEMPLRLADPLLARAVKLSDLESANERLSHSEQLQRALFAISDLAGSERDMPDLLRGIHAIVGSLMYAENFFIVLHDAERDTIRFLYFADIEDTAARDPTREIDLASRENTLTWYVIRDGRPLMGRTEELKQQISGPLLVYGPDSYDWLGVPMLRDGKVRGALVVQSYNDEVRYSAADRALLSFVASHILTALDRKFGQDELEKSVRLRTLELADANQGLQLEVVERERAERLQAALFQIAQMAGVDISQGEFYRRVHEAVGQLLNARNFFIALLSEDGTSLEFPYYVDVQQVSHPTRPLARGLSEYVLRHGQPLMGYRSDIDALAEQGEIELQTAGTPSVCWLGVPLFVGDEVIGLVAVQSYSASIVYGPADKELLTFVGSQIANSLSRRRAALIQQRAFAQLEQRVQERTQELREEIGERKRIQEQLKHQVMHDALTGLPNRGYMRERLERVLGLLRREPNRHAALLYLDIDRFKVINDSLGHLAGDAMLREVAARLQSCLRDPDLVARLSGDEFAILLEDVPQPETAVKVAQRILTALGMPMMVAGKEIEPSASIGIAIADAQYHLADDVFRDADIALYRAKAQGRKRFELFDVSLQKRAIDVLAMERDLRVALQNDQFEPYFQPIQSLDSGDVMGYEALIRWNHPERGLLAPGEFLGIAEESGSIEAIDWWMFEHSCALAAQQLRGDSYLTINVSPLHFKRPDLCERLRDMLRRTGLSPSRLVLEVTEGSLLDDPEGVRRILAELREDGVGAALDDFGTGYSSLSYLHTFPLRIVKIDRSFVARLGVEGSNSDAVVVSILALARALDIEAVAEGIETPAQRETLLAMGCRYGQGYLLGRPAPISAWLG